MSQNEQRKEILRQFLNEVWSDGDARSGGQVCRADLHDSSCSRRSVGEEATRPAGYKERVRTSRASFPNQRFDVQELSADGKAVVVTWRWPATHQGPLVGSPASGKAIRMSGATVCCFDQMRLGESAGRRAETAYLSATRGKRTEPEMAELEKFEPASVVSASFIRSQRRNEKARTSVRASEIQREELPVFYFVNAFS